ncbi:MAG: PASTA domain-containing protein, partial [Balneolales bacterium]|nr:PASTA domain-containing protein [Balneolales bacterium]
NFAITDMIEPGSTFKLVTAIAAVEQDKVDFEEIFETPENGEVIIHGLPLRDHDPLGNMNFQQVIQKSSNVATAEIAMRLDNNKFYQYARNMGFGTPTYVDIFGEESGRMAKPYEWSLVSLPWMSHGYELLTTPIQIAQAYSAFANEGKLMRPYIVDRIEDSNGNMVLEHEPLEIRQIAKEKTIEKLMPIFESVVSDSGTGDYAMVNGLRIAGKTGTAKKVVDGRYTNRYRGSFAGFFPVEDPKYVIYILLDEPKTSGYGGYTAGPIFKQIALRISGLDNDLQQQMIAQNDLHSDSLVVPHIKGLQENYAKHILEELGFAFSTQGIGGFVADQVPAAGTELNPGQEISLILSETNIPIDSASVREGFATIPELSGMNMRNATNLLMERGFEVERIGSGTVFAQFPRANELMRQGGKVTIRGRARSLETVTLASSNQ